MVTMAASKGAAGGRASPTVVVGAAAPEVVDGAGAAGAGSRADAHAARTSPLATNHVRPRVRDRRLLTPRDYRTYDNLS